MCVIFWDKYIRMDLIRILSLWFGYVEIGGIGGFKYVF